MVAPITVAEMKKKLQPLDRVREVLASTEPLSTYSFTVGDAVRFRVNPGWEYGLDAKAGTEPIDATIAVGKGVGTHEFPLTKDALLEAAAKCSMNRGYAAKCPAQLLEPQLNYWFREGLAVRRGANRDYQLLVAADIGAAITRSSIHPFSNLRLLEQAVAGIEAKYGKDCEILADYKFTHTLRKTHLRLIVPEHVRAIQATGTDDDTWSIGIQVKNSLIGEERTSLDGYLFRWACTNGQIDTHATSGSWRRTGGVRDNEVYDWARSAVDDVLGGLEGSLDAVQEMVNVPIEGQANDVLRDVFEFYRVPLSERSKIIENMVDTGGQLNMYTVMAAVTQVANEPGMEPAQVENLLRLGGDLPHAAGSRCEACRRLSHH